MTPQISRPASLTHRLELRQQDRTRSTVRRQRLASNYCRRPTRSAQQWCRPLMLVDPCTSVLQPHTAASSAPTQPAFAPWDRQRAHPQGRVCLVPKAALCRSSQASIVGSVLTGDLGGDSARQVSGHCPLGASLLCPQPCWTAVPISSDSRLPVGWRASRVPWSHQEI